MVTETPTASQVRTGALRAGLSKARGRIAAEQLGLVVALLAMVVVFAITAPNFLTFGNLTNILQQSSYLGIIAWGMTLVILAGEIDVSVGSAAAFDGVLVAVFLTHGMAWPLAVALTLLVGAVIGALAGWIRATFLIPSFIVTLALYEALRGLALLVTDAVPQAPTALTNSFFAFIGSGKVIGIPFAAVLLIVLFAVFWFIAARTTFGKRVYAIGGNSQAAYLAGIRIARVRVLLFAGTGLLAAVSGILLAAALGAGDPTTAQGLEFEVIAAVIVGGTNLFGGRGSMVGTAVGVLVIGVLSNGLVLVGINTYANSVVQGMVILVAVLVMSAGMRDRLRSAVRNVRLGSLGRGRS